ncbi:MAG: replication initiator protein [Arizlama microvirus]|nr:MAG: replication initiator protein [Arizlama microvirus]
MSCYHPIKAFRTATGVVFTELARYDIQGDIELPCGQCIGCRMRRASEWETRVMHEAAMWPRSCFVTLTYGRDRMPANGSLDHADFQLFMKRLRKSRTGDTVRFYMCGEYGEVNKRPHYHACLFNVDFTDRVPMGKSGSGSLMYDSEELKSLWGFGRVTVQDLVKETAGYCARYIMKKVLGDAADKAYSFVDEVGEVHPKRPEYAAMSLRPGIGARWFAKYGRDVYPHDFVVAEGVKRKPPRYYDKLFKRAAPVVMESVDFERTKRAQAAFADNTDERRQVREIVHTARASTLKRNLDV